MIGDDTSRSPVDVEGSRAVPARLRERVASMFAPDGALSRALPGFEPRHGQSLMAGRVADVVDGGGVLLAEAGTGTGKTLAYLVPAILSGQRVLISTGTKNLQEQIYFKDIPALRAALDLPFTATYMKGRANYLCLHRLEQVHEGANPLSHDVFLPIIREWARRTDTGDRAELDDLPEDLPFWNEVSATADTCLGAECPQHQECFVTRMRQRAAESDLVIVNHHLLCADAAVRQSAYGEVIPSCSHVIVDEAHQLEDVATQYFGVSVSNYRVDDLARDVEQAARPVSDAKVRLELQKAVDRLRDDARTFFTELAYAHRKSDRMRSEERIRVTAASLVNTKESGASLLGALDVLDSRLAAVSAGTSTLDSTGILIDDFENLVRRSREVHEALRFLLRTSDASYVFFVEFRGKGVMFRASPIDVSSIVRGMLIDRMRTTILTSATLTVDGGFDYVRERLGVRDADELRVPSEFDFERQAILYLPPKMPDPRSADFPMAAGREVVEILRRTRGRAFVLFTSYASLRAVQAIAEMALDYPILAQGSAPRTQLLQKFRDTPHSVLFATASFWQGVDVVGDALSCVIVDRLPFASPADPIMAARIDAIRARGGEPFRDYQVPLAILALQQGLGRLIRHRQDRGVLAILDGRLRTMAYGRRFIDSLPPAPVVHELRDIEGFFSIV